jgi:octaprenyl-diphosphate synthase
MSLQARRAEATGLSAGRGPDSLPPLAVAMSLVGEEMADAERALAAGLSSVVPAVSAISGYLVASGGKRLRPLITALGARAVGHGGDLVPLMCAGEVLHLGSLLHDDVVDGGIERRGRPAAHRVHGNAASVLARAVLLAAEGGGEATVVALSRVVTQMAEGEVQQLLFAGRRDLGLDQYFEIIERKSAALIAWCASAGALALGDAPSTRALAEFGGCVGIAFQLTDDVLDYQGDARQTGKQPGADLLEGKLTLPLLLALERSPALRALLDAGPLDATRLPQALRAVVETGACADTLAEARERVGRGVAALDALPDSPHRDALEALAWTLVERVR